MFSFLGTKHRLLPLHHKSISGHRIKQQFLGDASDAKRRTAATIILRQQAGQRLDVGLSHPQRFNLRKLLLCRHVGHNVAKPFERVVQAVHAFSLAGIRRFASLLENNRRRGAKVLLAAAFLSHHQIAATAAVSFAVSGGNIARALGRGLENHKRRGQRRQRGVIVGIERRRRGKAYRMITIVLLVNQLIAVVLMLLLLRTCGKEESCGGGGGLREAVVG